MDSATNRCRQQSQQETRSCSCPSPSAWSSWSACENGYQQCTRQAFSSTSGSCTPFTEVSKQTCSSYNNNNNNNNGNGNYNGNGNGNNNNGNGNGNGVDGCNIDVTYGSWSSCVNGKMSIQRFSTDSNCQQRTDTIYQKC
jgi:hypothetical protein